MMFSYVLILSPYGPLTSSLFWWVHLESHLTCEPFWFQLLKFAFVQKHRLNCSEKAGEEGEKVVGDELCWVFVGAMQGAQCPTVCDSGGLVMSWLAGRKALRSLRLGHRGKSLALFG